MHFLPQVSLDLASFEVVQFCWDALLDVLTGGLLHTVFANEEEAAALLKAVAAHADSDRSKTPADAGQAAAVQSAAAQAASSSPSNCEQAAAAGKDSASASSAATGSTDTIQNGGSAPANGHSAATANGSSTAEQDLLGDEAAAAQRWLLQYCQVAVVSLGPRGCVARDRQGCAAACVADRCT